MVCPRRGTRLASMTLVLTSLSHISSAFLKPRLLKPLPILQTFRQVTVSRKALKMVEASSPDASIDAQALAIIAELKAGTKTLSDLLGPLSGTKDMSVSIPVRPGNKNPVPVAQEADVSPMDEYNTKLVNNTHPPVYENPEPLDKYDLVVIGSGAAGLLSVIIANGLGKTCALVEKAYMGGDCLNVGCVPSKALIACSTRLHEVINSAEFGVVLPPGEVGVDFGKVMQRMRRIRSDISEHDSVERYSRDFVKHIFLGHGQFTSPSTIEVGGKVLNFNKAMVATGASASIPPTENLANVPHLTNANFWNLEELPPRMSVIGAGPIGLEMSQALQRFGCKVTCYEYSDQLLPKEDPHAAAVLKESLTADGLTIRLGARIKRVECDETGSMYSAPFNTYRIVLDVDGEEEVIESDALLNATGRAPNVFGVGLDEAGVDYDNRRGVVIDDYFRTTSPNIYACGDCASPYKFTHAADWQARVAIRNMFLGDKTKQSDLLIPWCTYTEPEVAHVGKYESELDEKGIEYESFLRNMADVDRCRCEGITSGFAKITVEKGSGGKILGATVVGPNAGDMISELTICIQNGVTIAQLAGTIHPYPTAAECVRQAANMYIKTLRTPEVNKALEIIIATVNQGRELLFCLLSQ
ncbi:unnamed protein product [Discosporangium mesarthrocarpum]